MTGTIKVSIDHNLSPDWKIYFIYDLLRIGVRRVLINSVMRVFTTFDYASQIPEKNHRIVLSGTELRYI